MLWLAFHWGGWCNFGENKTTWERIKLVFKLDWKKAVFLFYFIEGRSLKCILPLIYLYHKFIWKHRLAKFSNKDIINKVWHDSVWYVPSVLRKLKNRVAAQTARDRKKARMSELEQQVVDLEEEVKDFRPNSSLLSIAYPSFLDECSSIYCPSQVVSAPFEWNWTCN